MCHAVTSRETGSTSFETRSCEGPREMYDAACGRHCHSGSVCTEATHAIARSRAASFIGIPTQSPSSVLPVLSSSRTGVHSPDKSTPPACALTSSAGYCSARAGTLASAAANVTARTIARLMCRIFRLPRNGAFLRRLRSPDVHYTLLKDVLQRELQNPWIARRQNLPEGRAGQGQVRRQVLLRLPRLEPEEPVQRVERFTPEFEH